MKFASCRTKISYSLCSHSPFESYVFKIVLPACFLWIRIRVSIRLRVCMRNASSTNAPSHDGNAIIQHSTHNLQNNSLACMSSWYRPPTVADFALHVSFRPSAAVCRAWTEGRRCALPRGPSITPACSNCYGTEFMPVVTVHTSNSPVDPWPSLRHRNINWPMSYWNLP